MATLPKKVKTKALAGAKGVPIKVKVARAGKVKLSGTVPAKILSRTGKPVVVATGSAIAKRAGTVTVKLRLTAAARKKQKRLKGARMTLRVSQGASAAPSASSFDERTGAAVRGAATSPGCGPRRCA